MDHRQRLKWISLKVMQLKMSQLIKSLQLMVRERVKAQEDKGCKDKSFQVELLNPKILLMQLTEAQI